MFEFGIKVFFVFFGKKSWWRSIKRKDKEFLWEDSGEIRFFDEIFWSKSVKEGDKEAAILGDFKKGEDRFQRVGIRGFFQGVRQQQHGLVFCE